MPIYDITSLQGQHQGNVQEDRQLASSMDMSPKFKSIQKVVVCKLKKCILHVICRYMLFLISTQEKCNKQIIWEGYTKNDKKADYVARGWQSKSNQLSSKNGIRNIFLYNISAQYLAMPDNAFLFCWIYFKLPICMVSRRNGMNSNSSNGFQREIRRSHCVFCIIPQ